MKRVNIPFCLSLCVAGLALALLSGCDDQQAREAAADSGRKINELKIKLDQAEKKNDETAQVVKAAEERLMKHVDKRMDDIGNLMAENHKKLLAQLSQDVDKSRKDAMNLADTSREENKKELSLSKSMVSTDMQKIREELKAATEELRKFMDNQLKELYPYAYQPKRMDPSTPPAGGEGK